MSFKKSVCLLFLASSTVLVLAQNYSNPKVKWMTFEEVVHSQKSQKPVKKVMVDLYTENCGWCKKMDLSTFQNEFISHYINENFYPIRFDAKEKKDIHFNNHVFKMDKTVGFHELAVALSMGDLGFPTLVFLDESNQIIQPIPGYQTVDELERIMYYIANELYNKTLWIDFVQQFKPTNSKPRIDPAHPILPNMPATTDQVKKKN